MSEVIRDKIPFVGGYIAKLLTRTLVFISDRIKFDEGVFKPEVNSNEVKDERLRYLKSTRRSFESRQSLRYSF